MNDKAKGRTIRVFLAEGTPTGVLTAEIMNWTGHVLCAPRAKLLEMLQRSESARPGVYFLTGQDPDNANQTQIYVGESDSVAARLKQHNQNEDKGFWEYSCLITSKDQNLTKAHIRYLESRLIEIIENEGRATLRNSTAPSFDLLPEPDVADMEYFISQLLVLLPTLGFEFIRPTPKLSRASTLATNANSGIRSEQISQAGSSRQASLRDRPTADGGASPEFKLSAGGLIARAMEVEGQMIVLAGSQSRASEAPSLGSNVRQYRAQLRQSGKLVPSDNPEILLFKDDVAFTSPSAAAQAIMGTSRNGRTDWANTATGQTYAVWQEAQLAQADTIEN